jgi:hypothetical protein
MSLEKYLYDLTDIPDQYQSIFDKTNQVIRSAFDDPGKLKRELPGSYYIVLNDELIHIDNQEDEGGEWLAKECSTLAKWYTDGHSTLKELKKELGI